MTVAHHRKTFKLPHERTILLTLIALGLMASGSISWIKLKQNQTEAIQQAQFQLAEVCQADIQSNSSALEASSKVDEAIQKLQRIPHIPGLGYQIAQAQISEAAPCVQNIKKTADFYSAKQFSQAALAVNSSTMYSASEWQGIKTNLEWAIALLKNIPSDTGIYTSAQQDLQIYQMKLEEIDRRLQSETAAEQSFAIAEQLSREANAILVNVPDQSSPDETALSEAETKLVSAIQWLETISQDHKISAKSQENLAAYQQQLANIRYKKATTQLKTLSDDVYNFTTLVDITFGYDNYSEQLSQLNQRFYTLTSASPEILDQASVQSLGKALSQCNDAMTVWRYCHEGDCYSSWAANIPELRRNLLWIPASLQIGDSSLEQAYSVPTTSNIWGQPYVQQNLALSTIWEAAKKNALAARNAI